MINNFPIFDYPAADAEHDRLLLLDFEAGETFSSELMGSLERDRMVSHVVMAANLWTRFDADYALEREIPVWKVTPKKGGRYWFPMMGDGGLMRFLGRVRREGKTEEKGANQG